MKAEEFLKEKYRKGGCYPWSQFDIKEMVENMEEFAAQQVKLLNLHSVSKCPSELEPVLAKIEHINSIGKSSWYEVVYFDGNWRCYAGSNTFKDGEKVVKWRYCKDCC